MLFRSKPADIYSFAVTMYEIMIWEEIYPKTEFRFPWKIAEFVTEGNRLQKKKEMKQSHYDLVSICWHHIPNERYTAQRIIKELDALYLEEMNE